MLGDIAGVSTGRFIVAVVVVAIALLAFALALRWLKARGPSPFLRGGRNRDPRLQVLDAAAVDTRRRLVLVRRDNVEHLILIGGPTDVVIESGIRSAATLPAGQAGTSGLPDQTDWLEQDEDGEPELVYSPAPQPSLQAPPPRLTNDPVLRDRAETLEMLEQAARQPDVRRADTRSPEPKATYPRPPLAPSPEPAARVAATPAQGAPAGREATASLRSVTEPPLRSPAAAAPTAPAKPAEPPVTPPVAASAAATAKPQVAAAAPPVAAPTVKAPVPSATPSSAPLGERPVMPPSSTPAPTAPAVPTATPAPAASPAASPAQPTLAEPSEFDRMMEEETAKMLEAAKQAQGIRSVTLQAKRASEPSAAPAAAVQPSVPAPSLRPIAGDNAVASQAQGPTQPVPEVEPDLQSEVAKIFGTTNDAS